MSRLLCVPASGPFVRHYDAPGARGVKLSHNHCGVLFSAAIFGQGLAFGWFRKTP